MANAKAKARSLPIIVPTVDSLGRIAAPYAPSMAILIHTDAPPNGGNCRAMLTLHAIQSSREGAPHLSPGTIMGAEDGRTLGNLLLQADAARRYSDAIPLIPENVLTVEPDAVTWFLPAMRAPMHCKDAKGKRHALDVVWPHLILRVVRRELFVVAVDSAQRPTRQSRLYAAPLANVYAETSVCTGSATLPRGSDTDSIDGWNRVLLGTYNTHVNHPGTLANGATSEQLLTFWQRRVGKRSPPSARNYSPLGMTLNEWLGRTAAVQSARHGRR